MSRQEYNKLILETLSKLVKIYPDLRFGQLLVNCDILTHSEYPLGESNNGNLNYLINDPYYEESKITWERMLLNKFAFKELFN